MRREERGTGSDAIGAQPPVAEHVLTTTSTGLRVRFNDAERNAAAPGDTRIRSDSDGQQVMNTASKDQLSAYVRGLSRELLEQQLLERLLREIELGDQVRRALASVAGTRILRLSPSTTGMEVILEADGNEVARASLSDNKGAWFKYVLGATLEGLTPSALAVALFTKSPKPLDRANKVNNEIYTAIVSEIPASPIRIRATGTTRNHCISGKPVAVSSFEIAFGEGVEVVGPMFDAKACCGDATTAYSEGRTEAALESLLSAIGFYPAFFSPFALFLKCHGSDPATVAAVFADANTRARMLQGALSFEQWLGGVREGFDPASAPDYADAIKNTCIRDIDARLSAIARIRSILGDGQGGTVPDFPRNPLNLLLASIRDPQTPGFSAQEIIARDDFQRLRAKVSANLLEEGDDESCSEDDKNVISDMTSGKKVRDHQSRREYELLGALTKLAVSEKKYWFPEPAANESWEHASVLKWRRALLDLRHEGVEDISTLSMDADPDLRDKIEARHNLYSADPQE